MIRRIISLTLFILCAVTMYGQDIIRGTVCDTVTGEPLPYASIMVAGTSTGTTTNSDGAFTLPASIRGKTLQVSFLGYNTKTVKAVLPGDDEELDIYLLPTGVMLNEVVIKPRKIKYKKKGNPAVDFVRRVIASKNANDPRRHDYYSYDSYERVIFAKNDYTHKTKSNGKKDKFEFLTEFVDTLEEGIPILPVSEKERLSSVYYRKSPKSEKTVVKAYKSSGIDEIFSSNGVQQFLAEVFREVDIFKNDIPLFLQRFVSPLSSMGPNYYKYYLMDTLLIDSTRCVDLAFVPFNSETFGFTGHLYITLDSTYFVHRAVLSVPKDINLNFISKLSIDQTYERTADSTRLITKDDIRVNFKLSENTKGMYAQRIIIYSGHSFEEPPALDDIIAEASSVAGVTLVKADEESGTERAASRSVFDESSPTIELERAYKQTDEYWAANRPAYMADKKTDSVDKLMTRLKAIPIVNFIQKGLSLIVSGYIPTTKNPEDSRFDFGPINSIVNYNTLEGMRFRGGGATGIPFNEHLFLDGYVAYGLKDEKVKYDALVEYSFNDRKEYREEFPKHSIRLEYMYDINKLGQEYMYTSKDNMMLMIKRKKDTHVSYLRQGELSYYREHYNGVSYGAAIKNIREYSTRYAEFNRINRDGTVTPRDHYDMTMLEFKFRYAKNEKFYQTRNNRIPITFDAFIFNISHTMAKKGVLGSSYNYQRTDMGIQKRLWFSAFGYVDVILKTGKVWTKAPYPLLILPNANLTYTIQPESYTNMNALEFINDEYLSWDITYYMNGNLLNRLPFIKKLKWREVFCFRGLWGSLSSKNDPNNGGEGLYVFSSDTYRMGDAPYMEASVGIENILKLIRIDYVWRLNYHDHDDIQKHGVRATMHISF